MHTLLREAPPGLKPALEPLIDRVRPAVAFATHARHNTIAHRNLDVALGVVPLTLGSRDDVRGAMSAIDDVLIRAEQHFFQIEPTNYEFVANINGVESLLDIVQRGLRSRDQQFGYHRHPHPADPT